MMTRLERFRGYMARLNPAGSALKAVRDGLYVPRPGRSAADEIAARLELDPTSRTSSSAVSARERPHSS